MAGTVTQSGTQHERGGFVQDDQTIVVPDRELHAYAGRPVAFLLRYMRNRGVAHVMVFGSVGLAIGCAVLASYAIRHLVDVMTATPHDGAVQAVWQSVAILAALIAMDNLGWRIAGWFASRTFIEMTGDIRRDLFRFLTGHSPAYFPSGCQRLSRPGSPRRGMSASRLKICWHGAFCRPRSTCCSPLR